MILMQLRAIHISLLKPKIYWRLLKAIKDAHNYCKFLKSLNEYIFHGLYHNSCQTIKKSEMQFDCYTATNKLAPYINRTAISIDVLKWE